MPRDYSEDAQAASDAIREDGSLLAFTRTEKGPYDPQIGKASDIVTTFSNYCVWLNYSNSEIDGQIIQMGDAKVLSDPLGTKPAVGDVVTRAGEDWRVMDDSPLSPAGTDVLYTLQVRK